MRAIFILFIIILSYSCTNENPENKEIKVFSGIYPHLAHYNEQGECGTGAVVPWAGKLWVVTYSQHSPLGSVDKLYEINTDLTRVIRPESIGGTPANRMIHKESRQLFIGPYAIDSTGGVRAIPYSIMAGRHTGNARHLTDPANMIYYASMEEGFYEVDVKTLEVNVIHQDGNILRGKEDMALYSPMLPGAHGKGLYSGQGVLVYSNNGEASQEAMRKFDIETGSLNEWDGHNWKMVRRTQFVEVTGPGGINGNQDPENDPIWVTGWDYRSLIVGVRDTGKWSFYRLPKASNSNDGSHGFYTEWPRIRDVGTAETPDYLMTMHGMFWRFPETFSSSNSSGIRPRSAYLKVIADFTRWNDQLVFGCDDAAKNEFANRRSQKGTIQGAGQSNSNLWFTSPDKPDNLGPATAVGAVWISEEIKSGQKSEPFLFAGWDYRTAWIKNEGDQSVSFNFETDKQGNNNWENLKSVSVAAGETAFLIFENSESGEWVRISTDEDTKATVHFSYTSTEKRKSVPDDIFTGIARVDESTTSGGLLYSLGDDRRALGILAGNVTNEEFIETGYYELDSLMNLERKEDTITAAFIRSKFAIPQNVVTFDEASVLINDDRGRRWRLPMGTPGYADLTEKGVLRICREVVTERDLFNCAGTFYELPAENADGFAKIRPVSTHQFRIHDYNSYRGMLIITGLQNDLPKNNNHIIKSKDGKAALWAGTIDDLWNLGKPTGEGGPWKNTTIMANNPSDPYLIGFYDKRSLKLSHNSAGVVNFIIEAEPIGHGPWMTYKRLSVKPGETLDFTFPDAFQSRWIRFVSDQDCNATAWLIYN